MKKKEIIINHNVSSHDQFYYPLMFLANKFKSEIVLKVEEPSIREGSEIMGQITNAKYNSYGSWPYFGKGAKFTVLVNGEDELKAIESITVFIERGQWLNRNYLKNALLSYAVAKDEASQLADFLYGYTYPNDEGITNDQWDFALKRMDNILYEYNNNYKIRKKE